MSDKNPSLSSSPAVGNNTGAPVKLPLVPFPRFPSEVKQILKDLLSVTNGPPELLKRDIINQAEFVFREKKARAGEDASLTVLNEKNVQICTGLIRSLKNNTQFQMFFEVLDDTKLKFYQSSMEIYLARTGGVPPTDFSTILSNLKNVRDEHSPYKNKVSIFFQDVINVVHNAMKFNPPDNFVFQSAVILARQIRKTFIRALRRNLVPVDSATQLVCYSCGNGESDAGNQLMACEFCNLWWHQHCEGVTTVPPGAYYCKVCSREHGVQRQMVVSQRIAEGSKLNKHQDSDTEEDDFRAPKRKKTAASQHQGDHKYNTNRKQFAAGDSSGRRAARLKKHCENALFEFKKCESLVRQIEDEQDVSLLKLERLQMERDEFFVKLRNANQMLQQSNLNIEDLKAENARLKRAAHNPMDTRLQFENDQLKEENKSLHQGWIDERQLLIKERERCNVLQTKNNNFIAFFRKQNLSFPHSDGPVQMNKAESSGQEQSQSFAGLPKLERAPSQASDSCRQQQF